MLTYGYMKISTPKSAAKINAMQEAQANSRRNSNRTFKVVWKVEA